MQRHALTHLCGGCDGQDKGRDCGAAEVQETSLNQHIQSDYYSGRESLDNMNYKNTTTESTAKSPL